jgi:hypothetical protein
VRVSVIPGSGGRRYVRGKFGDACSGPQRRFERATRSPALPPFQTYCRLAANDVQGQSAKCVAARTCLFEHLVGVHTRGSRWVIARRSRCEPAPAHRCRGCLASALERHYGPPLVLLQRHVRQVFVKLHLLRRRGIHVVGRLDPGIHGVGVCLYRSVHLVDVANIVVEVVGAWRVRRP